MDAEKRAAGLLEKVGCEPELVAKALQEAKKMLQGAEKKVEAASLVGFCGFWS